MRKILFPFLLLFLSANAQTVGGYGFVQSTESYTPVVGTNSTATGDDGTQNTIPIGFNLNFGGATYTTFSISTNGFIRLGNVIANQSWVNALSATSTQSPLIAAFWDDHNRSTGSIQYAVTGSSPNRTLEIGWDAISLGNNGVVTGVGSGSFKMRLQETTGVIEFIYGPTMTPAGSLSASIGLNDMTSFLSISATGPIASSSNTVANNAISNTSNLLGQKFTFLPQPQCSGTPNPGATLVNVNSACSGYPFGLRLENIVEGFGISYQWQSSSNGTDFVAIPNAVNATLTLSQTSATFYQCVVTCGNENSISTPVQVTMSDPGTCFCFPSYTNGKTAGDLISNVVITGTTLSNNTGTAPVNPYYTYFSGQPNLTAILQTGVTYDLNVTVGTYQQQHVAVWIDYNDDAFFSADERVGYSLAEIGSNETGVIPISIGCAAVPGVHRMRIRDVWNTEASTLDPCANYSYGETEDYDVTIETPIGCQAPLDLNVGSLNSTGAQLTWAAGCNASAFDVHLTTAGAGLPLGDPSHPGVVSPLVINGLSPSTGYDFYVRASCSDTTQSDWVGPFTFTTLPVAVANDDCETAVSLVVGSTFEEHALIGTNVGATKTIGPPNPTCAIFGFGGDVWYSVVVPPDGNVKLEVRQDPGSLFTDSGLTAFSGDCNNLTTIGCSDDEGIGGFSLLNLTGLTPGQIIYARVWEFANDTFGTFQFSAYNTALSSSSFDEFNLKIFPNPVKDVLTISYQQDISVVQLIDVLGQVVINKRFDAQQAEISMSGLVKGTYFLKLTSGDRTKICKVFKE